MKKKISTFSLFALSLSLSFTSIYNNELKREKIPN